MKEDIVFPGTNIGSNSSLPILTFSANLGTMEYDGTDTSQNIRRFAGMHAMIELINADPSILPNFKLQVHGTDCGNTKFNYDHFMDCMRRHKNNLGSFYKNH